MIASANSDLNEPRESTLEQAALRRIATLVSGGVEPRELFAAVAEEVGRVVDAPSVSVSRYEDDGTVTVCGTFPPDSPRFPIGMRVSLEGNSVPSLVRERVEPARLDDFSELDGEIGEAARRSGMRSSVGVPIVVAGGVWGVIIASETERLPEVTEARLSEFTELLAAAIAHTQGREALTELADEQAALRRVASLVAAGVQPHELFAAVAEEVGRVVDAPYVAVARYESAETATVCGTFPRQAPLFRSGSRVSLDGVSVLGRIRAHGKPARIDDYSRLTGEVAEVAQASGIRSGVGVPIVVAGRVWGSIVAWSAERLPDDFEARLAELTELLAAAISSTGAHEALAQLADEQAALRDVATLVAGESSPGKIFDAVTEAACRVLDTEAVGLLRFEPDGTATLVAQSETPWDPPPLGTRFTLDGENLIVEVSRTGRAARLDDWAGSSGSVAAMASVLCVRSAVAAPVVVEGRLWGTLVAVTSQNEPLPAEMESQIGQFTGLITTAIANAESRDALARLAAEQAALRRVATLVAQDPPSNDVFTAVTEELGHLVPTQQIAMSRYDSDNMFTTVAVWSPDTPAFPVGLREPPGGNNVMTIVLETGRPARINDYSASASGPIGDGARRAGVRSSVGIPIIVAGRLWGVMSAGSTHPEPMPADTEARLASFTELVATAIANAESRDALARLADEQAALRRVATLVAQDAPAATLFEAVVAEVGELLDANLTVLGRYDGDGAATAVGSWSSTPEAIPVGTRSSIGGRNVLSIVAETGRPARLDGYDDATGEAAEIARRYGWRSSIAAPITVEGRVWGVMLVATQREQPFPAGDEGRLAQFTDLIATSIANAESKSELAQSRRRIVAASDEARRKIQRDLHDGTQQRLVSLGFAVRKAETSLPPERDDLRAQLSGVATGLVAALEDLQEISRGIHPAILSKGGLGPALRGLAHRSVIPVDLDVTTDVRPAEPIEVAAYFVASEALANAAKHSEASCVGVSLEQRDGRLVLSVRDDGVGGADAARGSGLVGLADRVEALGGTIAIHSSAGKGTCIVVTLPIAPEPDREIENYLVLPQELASPSSSA